jgi:hypothetical protein
MLAYNITLKIEPEIEADWVVWQKEEHIPEVMATGCFTHNSFFKLLEQDESDGSTYIVQYFAARREDYDRYINEHATEMRQRFLARWGNRFVAFRTLMQVVN